MSNPITDMLEKLNAHIVVSPATVTQYAYDFLDDAYNGELEISDATNPFVKLLECTSTQTASCLMRAEELTRRKFARLATTWKELYPHMSDADYRGRFSKPNEDIIINYGLSRDEILDGAVLDATKGVRKLTIPKDTVFSNTGVDFYLHWPLDILVSSEGTITAQYDLSFVSPLKTIETNTINVTIQTIEGQDLVIIPIRTDQISVISENTQISESSGSSLNIPFTDSFYYARVYSSLDDTVWTELVTTHDEQVHDSTVPTAVLTVTDGLLNVKIPDIYLTTGLVTGTLRVEVYTTKGATSLNMSDYEVASWSVTLNDFSNLTTAFSSPVNSIATSLVFSSSLYTGGSNGLTFDELRERVVYGIGDDHANTTSEELRVFLADRNFGMVKQKDTVGERVYVATRELPVPIKDDLHSSIGVQSAMLVVDSTRLDLAYCMVINNGMPTIKPNALFKEVDGGISFLPHSEASELNSLSSPEKVGRLNEIPHLFTPFHYVVDNTLSVIETRAYYLGKPEQYYRRFIENNASMGFFVTTTNVAVSWDETTNSYELIILAAVPGSGDALNAVLNFVDDDGEKWDLVGERTIISDAVNKYVFTLGSLLDIDADNFFTLTGMSHASDKVLRVKLTDTKFDLVYVADGVGTGASALDDVLARVDLTETVVSISHEQVSIKWGFGLDGLYTRTRPVITEPEYETYPASIPSLYEKNEFEMDSLGRAVIKGTDGTLGFNLLHVAGTQKESNGELEWLHKAGDIVIDGNTGTGKLKRSSSLEAEVRTVLMDARYIYSDTALLEEYRASLPVEINKILTMEIGDFGKKMIAGTDLYYEPVSGSASALAELEHGRSAIISTKLKFSVTVTLTHAAYKKTGLRPGLTKGVLKLILEAISGRSIAVSDVYEQLKDLSPENVKGVYFPSPIPGSNYALLKEDTAAWTLASKAVIRSSGEFDIVDDLEVTFIE